MSLLHVRYHWGGAHPLQGLDCSGLCIFILKSCGAIKDQRFDTTAQGLLKMYSKAGFSKPEFGALAFYGSSLDKVTHVGFCLSETLMIHAGGGDSSVVDFTRAEEKGAFVKINAVTYRKDFLVCAKPDYSKIF